MTIAPSRSALDRLETLFTLGAVGRLTDAELLARFVRGRGDVSAEAAFAVLVDRHGPMVLGACRRATGDPHLADDAFQATFLILARKARSIRLDPDDSAAGCMPSACGSPDGPGRRPGGARLRAWRGSTRPTPRRRPTPASGPISATPSTPRSPACRPATAAPSSSATWRA